MATANKNKSGRLKEALTQTCGFQLHQMEGYEFLLRLVLSFMLQYFHPRPNDLILFRPKQELRDSLQTYFKKVLIHIFLCGLNEDKASGIEEPIEISYLFSCAIQSDHYHWMYEHKRD